MQSWGVLARSLVLAMAIGQAGMPSVLAFADASQGATASAVEHVEDQTRRSCVPVHSDDCTVCRALSTSAPIPDAQDVSWTTDAVVRAPGTVRVAIPVAPHLRQHPSRAPPAA